MIDPAESMGAHVRARREGEPASEYEEGWVTPEAARTAARWRRSIWPPLHRLFAWTGCNGVSGLPRDGRALFTSSKYKSVATDDAAKRAARTCRQL